MTVETARADMKALTGRQTLALQNPCTYAIDTLQPIYWQPFFFRGRMLSTILTVNK